MPFCEKCGNMISESANFCFKCGAKTVHKSNHIQNNQLELNLLNTSNPELINSGRKRKWTDDLLIKELNKYQTLEHFKKEKPHLWVIVKNRNLTGFFIHKTKILLNNLETKQISVKEYVDKISKDKFSSKNNSNNINVSRQAVKYRINNGMSLPDVISYKKIGKVHVLTVRIDF